MRSFDVAHGVPAEEYARLLELPPERLAEGRFRALDRMTRAWYAAQGSPWTRVRTVAAGRITSPAVARRLRRSDSQEVAILAVTAGSELEEEAAARWDSRPEEAWFLDRFGAAVVEHLVALLRTTLHRETGASGSLPPLHAPGYVGWDLSELGTLMRFLRDTDENGSVGPLRLTAGGMITPRNSLVGLQGLGSGEKSGLVVACHACGLDPCNYRRGVTA